MWGCILSDGISLQAFEDKFKSVHWLTKSFLKDQHCIL